MKTLDKVEISDKDDKGGQRDLEGGVLVGCRLGKIFKKVESWCLGEC